MKFPASIFLIPTVLGSLFFVACQSLPDNPPQTVSSVDLSRYAGLWYEVARLPAPFQDAEDLATAEYTLNADEGSVEVVNTAIRPDGSTESASGTARPVEGSNNSKLMVTFDNFFARVFGSPPDFGNYWILKLDADYAHVLVGSPDRDYLWLLAREPSIAPELLNEYIDYAENQGYDTADVIINNGSFPDPIR